MLTSAKASSSFEIDPRPYRRAIDQPTRAAIDKDAALSQPPEWPISRATACRPPTPKSRPTVAVKALAKDGLISKDQNSTYQTTFNSQNEALRADQAAINSAKASLTVDFKAALETAELNLSYCSTLYPHRR